MNAARTSYPTILSLALCTAVALQSKVGGMIVVPMTRQDLIDSSALIVLGTVDSSSAEISSVGKITTHVTISVEEQIKGGPQAAVTVAVPGGAVGNVWRVVIGAPSFFRGERVLVFLRYRPSDGALMLNGLAMGKYTVVHSPAGDVAEQALGGIVPDDVRPLGEFVTTLRGLVAGEPSNPEDDATVSFTENGGSRFREAFSFMNPPGRWVQPDLGQPVVYHIDPTGDAACGAVASQDAVARALAAWSSADASLRLLDGTPAAPAPFSACDGASAIQFNDPFDEIGSMVNCTGILAVGGFCSTNIGTSTVGGITYERITEGDVTVSKGLTGCAYWNPTALAEVLTHELGHTLGLSHSSEDAQERDPLLRDATMYFLAHLDGRGAVLRIDDIAAVQALYPLSVTPAPTPTPTPTVTNTPRTSASVTPNIRHDNGGGCVMRTSEEARPGAWFALGLLILALRRATPSRCSNPRSHSSCCIH